MFKNIDKDKLDLWHKMLGICSSAIKIIGSLFIFVAALWAVLPSQEKSPNDGVSKVQNSTSNTVKDKAPVKPKYSPIIVKFIDNAHYAIDASFSITLNKRYAPKVLARFGSSEAASEYLNLNFKSIVLTTQPKARCTRTTI